MGCKMLDNLRFASALDNTIYLPDLPLNAARYRVEFMRFSVPSDLQTPSGNADEQEGLGEATTTLNWRLQQFLCRVGS
jgi:hypothetical protein